MKNNELPHDNGGGVLNKIASKIEMPLAYGSAGLYGITLAAPNPYTLGAARVLDILSIPVDGYQAYRSYKEGNYADMWKNIGEIGLNLFGLKLLSKFNKPVKGGINLVKGEKMYSITEADLINARKILQNNTVLNSVGAASSSFTLDNNNN